MPLLTGIDPQRFNASTFDRMLADEIQSQMALGTNINLLDAVQAVLDKMKQMGIIR